LLPLAEQLNRWGITALLADYRTQERFGTLPMDAVDDALCAWQWLEEQATSLRLDPQRVAVGGMSAGGYLALRAAIGAQKLSPRALVLFFPVSDFGPAGHAAASRHFNLDLTGLSILPMLPARVPPAIIFHGTDDQLVPFGNSAELQQQLQATGNRCDLVALPGQPHGVRGPAEWASIFSQLHPFLRELQLSTI
jgi:acetyl esterase/lipase